MHVLEQHDCLMYDCLTYGDYYFTKSVTSLTKYYLVVFLLLLQEHPQAVEKWLQ